MNYSFYLQFHYFLSLFLFSVSIPTASRQNDDSDLSDNEEDGPPPIPPRDAYVRNGKFFNITLFDITLFTIFQSRTL